jgi:lipoic acid synthetase
MVGIGETDVEVEETMCDLLAAGVDIVTLGQYLRPKREARQSRALRSRPRPSSVTRRFGRERGFAYVASGPLVRSSYHAAEGFALAGFALARARGHHCRGRGSARPGRPAR